MKDNENTDNLFRFSGWYPLWLRQGGEWKSVHGKGGGGVPDAIGS